MNSLAPYDGIAPTESREVHNVINPNFPLLFDGKHRYTDEQYEELMEYIEAILHMWENSEADPKSFAKTVYATSKIENINVPFFRVQSLLEKYDGPTNKHEYAILNVARAYEKADYLRSQEYDHMNFDIQYGLLPPHKIGRLRDVDVRVGDYICPPREDAYKMLQWLPTYLDGYWEQVIQREPKDKKTARIVLAALYHALFVSIHPYIDGNGRTTRLLHERYLTNSGFSKEFANLFTIACWNRRLDYYKALQAMRLQNHLYYFLKFILDATAGVLFNRKDRKEIQVLT